MLPKTRFNNEESACNATLLATALSQGRRARVTAAMSLNDELSNLFATFAALMEIKAKAPQGASPFPRSAGFSGFAPRRSHRLRKRNTERHRGPRRLQLPHHHRLRQHRPQRRLRPSRRQRAGGALAVAGNPGWGPRLSPALEQRNITSMEDLSKPSTAARWRPQRHCEKKIQSIKEGIALRSQAAQRMGIGEALPIAEDWFARLRQRTREAGIAASAPRRELIARRPDLRAQDPPHR